MAQQQGTVVGEPGEPVEKYSIFIVRSARQMLWVQPAILVFLVFESQGSFTFHEFVVVPH